MMKRTGLLLLVFSTLLATPALAAPLVITVLSSKDGSPVANAVVYLDHTSKVTPVTAEVVQQDRQFHPQVLVIPKGSLVEFPNHDNTRHQVYSFSHAKTFTIDLYVGRPEAPILFDKAGIVEIGCNIHDQMHGFILVMDTPVEGTTDAHGKVTLALGDVKPNTPIRIDIWHPRLPNNTSPLVRTVTTGQPATLHIELTPKAMSNSPMDLLQQRFKEIE